MIFLAWEFTELQRRKSLAQSCVCGYGKTSSVYAKTAFLLWKLRQISEEKVAVLRDHLNNAPIREAVIDIAIASRAPIAAIDAVAKDLKSAFPKQSAIWQTTFGFRIDEDGPGSNSAEQSRLGVRMDSSQPPLVLQYRINGMALSRLHPYTDWEELCDAAKPYWKQFAAAAGPTTVTRLAVRYINALRLPLPMEDFADYLVAPPQVPAELPQSVSGFLQRVTFADPKRDYAANVTQALESVIDTTEFTVLLDIDVYRVVELSPDSDDIWSILNTLRTAKNEIFFRHLTEKAVEIFA